MPYIKEDRRELILIKKASPQGWRKMLVIDEIENSGEINYAVTELILHFFKNKTKQNYQAMNDIVGALELAKNEFEERLIKPYEKKKAKENGDVY